MKKVIGPIFGLDDGIFNQYFNYALYVESISLIFKYIVTDLFFLIAQKKYIIQLFNTIPSKLNINKIKISEKTLFICFCVSFILLSSSSFGLINWIFSPRTGYQLYRVGNGGLYAITKLFLSAFIGLYFLYSKNIIVLGKRFILIIPIAFLLGSKGFLLDMGIYLFIVVWFMQYKNTKKLYAIFLPIIFVGMLFIFKPSNIDEIIAYFDYYINSANYYEAYFNGEIELFNGKLFLTNFWELVPRGLFPEKPFVYGILYINEYFFPGAAEATNTPAFGGPIGPYGDFGIIGVALSSFLDINLIFRIAAYCIIFSHRTYASIITNPLCVFLIILEFAPQFLDFFGFPLNILFYIFICVLICWSSRYSVTIHHK